MLNVEVFKIGNAIALPELYEGCMRSLCDAARVSIVNYPEKLKAPGSTDVEWALKSPLIRALNEESILAAIGASVNCFSIHTKSAKQDWRMRFIGQTDPKRVRAYMTRLLIPTADSGSRVMALCKDAVRNGAEIGLRMIRVEPDTLRAFIQEKAINELRTTNVLDWNRGSSWSQGRAACAPLAGCCYSNSMII